MLVIALASSSFIVWRHRDTLFLKGKHNEKKSPEAGDLKDGEDDNS
jgi:hypothetical protein